MKTPHELEYRALAYLDALEGGQPSSLAKNHAAHFPAWPGPPRRAARLLAAHANAARGQDVMWLVGVRPTARGKLALPGALRARFETWLQGLLPFFDGLAPTIRAYDIPAGTTANRPGQLLVALHIETARVPFVFQANPEGTTLEVPWWDGAAGHLRSAGRQELIRLLVPIQALPQFEVLEAELTFYKNLHAAGPTKITHRWTFDGSLYVIPHHDTATVIPLHRCHAHLSIPGSGFTVTANDLTLTADKQSPSVRITESAALIEGLGRTFVYCSGTTTTADIPWQSPLTVTFDLLPAGSERAAVVSASLRSTAVTESNQAGRWKL